LFYAAVSRARELLVLSWHGGDDDGQATPRSLFVDDVCDLFDRGLFARRARRALGAVQAPPASPAQPRGAERPPQPRPGGALAQAPLRDAAVLADLAARPWSPSSLERWIGCPVAWFVERLLRPERFEAEPEPLARGGLAHDALRSTLEALRRETGSARITRGTLARARELLAAALSEGERLRPLSAAPESRATLRRRLQADLERYLGQQAEHESPLEPRELERGFGFAEDDERGEAGDLPALELGAGLALRGRIDRIDVGASGEAVVYDYKGKDPPGAARWSGEGKLQVALYMHAAERLLGLRAVGGLYQPLAGSDLRARGALERDSGVELDCVATDVLDHEQLRELLGDAIERAREAAGQATRGELQARPDTCAFRGGCMYPAICRCER
jgi:ATP-dependent helicase/nuclease subunit B